MPKPLFSSAIRQEIAIALNDFSATDEASHARLAAACKRVCTEAHALHLSATEMEATLRRLYAELPGGGASHDQQAHRRVIFDRFLSGCVEVYDDADRKSDSARA